MSTLRDLLEEDPAEYDLEYRVHATRRMFERGVNSEDIEGVLRDGHIIERYDDELPLRHLLLNGKTASSTPLHVVVVVHLSEKRLTVITLYEPDSSKWMQNFSRRRP